jgi:hypothetical protein
MTDATWRDRNGTSGAQYSKVRTLVDCDGLASVAVDRDEPVRVPAGATASVLYVNPDMRIVGLEFRGEGSVFGNLAWDAVEIVNDKQS